MITMIAGWLIPLVGERFAKPAAIAALAILAIGLLWGAKAIYDAGVIERAVNKANAEFFEDKDEAAGKADKASDTRRDEHEARVATTEELIDEALEKGCAVGEYLVSDGANCVQ